MKDNAQVPEEQGSLMTNLLEERNMLMLSNRSRRPRVETGRSIHLGPDSRDVGTCKVDACDIDQNRGPPQTFEESSQTSFKTQESR